MSRIWAVARHMIAEGIRMKIALVFIAIIALLMLTLPFMVAGDGVTLKSRVQSFLSYALGAMTFMLSMLTVFLSCSALSNEIQNKQIFMVASKPIPRWHFFLGKWLGIATLNTMILLIAGLSIAGFTWYLRTLPTDIPGDREAVESEVLTARYTQRPQEPNFDVILRDWEQQMREQGHFSQTSAAEMALIREQRLFDIRRGWRSIGPGQWREYRFDAPLVNREDPGTIQVRIQPASPAGTDHVMFRMLWQAGDLSDVNTVTRELESDFVAERYHVLQVPKSAINNQGVLHLRLANLTQPDTLIFTGEDSLELLYGIGSFGWNLFRALCIIWCRLAFLAALGLLASSFLSFPVACVLCLMILLVAIGHGFLNDAIQWTDKGAETGSTPSRMYNIFSLITGRALLWIIPDFSRYDPIGNMVSGQVVTLMWVMLSFVELIFIKGLLLVLAGCTVFTKRELAQVVV
ncbi:MAG: ABC transporter permease [Phycisphaerales bacterium]|nr:ABC transporter permease [Phycisphaerales bacterium]